ncbi:ABC transporter permease [Haloprofundus halobius]|uniref:ABC transporter permease n=1 Tax=Haloprofundus halobius TaxID=2876194 RepID=UPI001CCEC0DF|nr:ABC transporter permease [Haloprofundus halobius]
MKLDRRFPAILMARRNLDRNRLRSALAALGIVIGVLAIATLGIFGNVLQLSATNELGAIGNQVVVGPNQDAGVTSLSAREVETVEQLTAGRGTAVPLISDGAVVSNGRGQSFATLYGISTPTALFSASEGTIPDRHRQGALVGAELADRLDLRVGSIVDIEGNEYRVVAVLAPTEDISPVSPDNGVVLPPEEFVSDEYNQVVVRADSGEAASHIAASVRERLNAREERVTVFEFSTILDQIGEFFALLNAFLLGLAGISLVVAGVSIFNVMLMSTSERRGEIGVLRAVGVQRRDVLRMLVVEAALLGTVGGAIGATLSALVTAGLYYFTPVTLAVALDPSNGLYLVGAFVFGVVVSLVSGLYPAWRAANEPPVEALRG